MASEKIKKFLESTCRMSDVAYVSRYDCGPVLEERGWKDLGKKTNAYYKDGMTLILLDDTKDSFITDYPRDKIKNALKEKYATHGMAFWTPYNIGVLPSALDSIQSVLTKKSIFLDEIGKFVCDIFNLPSYHDFNEEVTLGFGAMLVLSTVAGGIGATINKFRHKGKKKEAEKLLKTAEENSRIRGIEAVLEEIL